MVLTTARVFEKKASTIAWKDLVENVTSHITVAELKSAELKVAIYEQRRYLSNLILALKNGNRLSSKVCSRSIRKLNPFISHNVVRVGEKLEKASIKGFVRLAIVNMLHGSEVKRPVSKMCVVVPATSKNDIPSWIPTV